MNVAGDDDAEIASDDAAVAAAAAVEGYYDDLYFRPIDNQVVAFDAVAMPAAAAASAAAEHVVTANDLDVSAASAANVDIVVPFAAAKAYVAAAVFAEILLTEEVLLRYQADSVDYWHWQSVADQCTAWH